MEPKHKHAPTIDISNGQSLAQSIFDPQKLASAIWRRKYLVVLICALGIATTVYYTSRLEKLYYARASVMIDNPSNPEKEQQLLSEFPKIGNGYRVLAMTLRPGTAELGGEKVIPGIDTSFEVHID